MRRRTWLAAAAAICFAAMCGADSPVQKPPAEVVPQDANGNFVLYVSNQSHDITPVDITILIDGKKAVSAEFAVGNSHNWVKHTFQLAPGRHTLTAVSKKGEARIEKEFEVKEKHWVVVDYYYSARGDGKKQFSFHFQDTPVAFA